MRLHQAIRTALGADYQTFLQGSYRNETAIANINDVDIVARRRRTMAGLTPYEWEDLFVAVADRLGRSPRLVGALSAGDKCIRVEGPVFNADVVPAVAIENFKRDPIAIWSRRDREERDNYPRVHIRRGASKHASSGQAYKPTVRLFKRWASQYDDMADLAPSFYIECAVHAVSASRFQSYLPRGFLNVGMTICGWTVNDVIESVAGDKDILVDDEWHSENFLAFQERLADDLAYVVDALRARSARPANEAWKLAFGEA
jgi:hypothetical protein